MNFYSTLEDCWETVVAAMANQIEHMQNELDYKNKRIERLTLENEAMKIRREDSNCASINCPHTIKPVFDSSKDPFEGGGRDE